MARPEVTGKKFRSTEERDAYSIEEFCRRHNLSHGTYYNMRAAGIAPREARVLGRILISKEAAADWRRARETKPAEVA